MLSGRPRVGKNIIISTDTTNWDIIDNGFGGIAPTGPASVVIQVNSDVNISGILNGIAMDLKGLVDGSTIRIVNLGNIYGQGGLGGDGRDVWSEEESGICAVATTGGSAGISGRDAIQVDGNVDVTIENVDGRIWGGGGGGGGGNSRERSVPPCQSGAGGGGGGGAGADVAGGPGGSGGSSTQFGIPVCTATSGNAGTGGVSGAGGSGGAGCGGSCTGGPGGAGGDFGASGVVGGFGGLAGGSGGGSVNHLGAGSITYTTGGVQGVDIKGATS